MRAIRYPGRVHGGPTAHPYGGGHGMVMKVEPVARALESIKGGGEARVILTTPQGAPFKHCLAEELSKEKRLIIVCGRYEGVDERIRDFVDLELSIGDYVLTGGELPALVVIDAVIRLLPGAIDDLSTAEESFSAGLLEYPQYTRPASFRDLGVPPILTSGDHGAVARWRHERAVERTRARRPDLLPPDER